MTDTAGALAGKVLTGGTEPLSVTLGIGEMFMDADFGYASAAIEVVKEGDRRVLLEPEGEVNYTITTRYLGDDLLSNVTVTDPLPEGTTYLSSGQGSTLGSNRGL